MKRKVKGKKITYCEYPNCRNHARYVIDDRKVCKKHQVLLSKTRKIEFADSPLIKFINLIHKIYDEIREFLDFLKP